MPPSVQIIIDTERYANLARVEQNSTCGFIHLGELAGLIRQFMHRSHQAVAQTITWVDLLSTLGIATGQQLGRQEQHLILVKDRRVIEPIWYEGNRKLPPISIPPTIWIMKFLLGRLVGYRLFIASIRPLRLDQETSIYVWPYGNIYEGGAVCWGTMIHPTITLSAFGELDHIFMTSAFNGDLTRPHGQIGEWTAGSMLTSATAWKQMHDRWAMGHPSTSEINPFSGPVMLDPAPSSLPIKATSLLGGLQAGAFNV